MAEEPIKFEQQALSDLYGRIQQESMGRWGDIIKTTTGRHADLESYTPEGTVADTLGEQAAGLTAADEALASFSLSRKGASRGEQAANIERGIQSKLKAMGMLDDAIAADDGIEAVMTPDYVDPVTGERVNADSLDQVSSNAMNRFQRDAIDSRNAGNLGADLLGGLSYVDGEEWNISGHSGTHKVLTASDSFWGDAFGEAGADMKKSHEDGILDLQSVYTQIAGLNRNLERQGKETATQALNDERKLRQENALATAESFKTSESLAQTKKSDLAAAAMQSKSDLNKSITKDKQTLARQSHGDVNDNRAKKTRIDYGNTGGGSRPV